MGQTMTLATAIARELDRKARVSDPLKFTDEARRPSLMFNIIASLDSLAGLLPSGSGIDSGTVIGQVSTAQKLVLEFGFHHMVHGYYDGWTYHKAVVQPCLMFGLDLRVTGPNRNQIKDYLHETYLHALTSTVRCSAHGGWFLV